MWRKWILPAFCVGVILAFFLSTRGTWLGWCCLCFFFTLSAILLFRRNAQSQYATIAAIIATLFIGMFYSLWRTNMALEQQWPPQTQPQAIWLNVEIDGLPEQDQQGHTHFLGKAQTEDGHTFHILFQDYLKRRWQVGEYWRFKARVRAPIAMRNPVGFDREAWALANGIDGSAFVGRERIAIAQSKEAWLKMNYWRAKISAAWQRSATISVQGAGLMQALAVGYRAGLSQEAWAAFRPLGLNHLISISGLHISMVAILVAWLCKQLMRILPRVPAQPRIWQLLFGLLAAGLYTGLAGWEIPALRSFLMLLIFAWAWLQRSVWNSWRIWWTALTVVLLYQPTSVLAAGTWLSFGLVGGLIWTLGFRLPERGWKQAIRGQWAATLLGAIGSVYFFGVLAPFSPMVNAIAIPFFSWVLTPLALIASVSPFDFIRNAAVWLSGKTINILLFLSQILPETALAHAPTPLLFLALICAMIILLPNGLRLKPLAWCGIILFILYRPSAPQTGTLRIQVIDVGQGLSVLLQTHNHNILFDTGTPAAEFALMPNLRALGIHHLDQLILSHHDNDHDGGYPAIRKEINIKQLFAGQPEYYPKAQYCADGTTWQADGVVFEFLTPAPKHDGKDNDNSCVLRAILGKQAIMITGDLGAQGEQDLVTRYGDALFSQILVLGHHGSKTASSPIFIQTVNPQIGIASSGFANRFKHPHQEVIHILSDNDVTLMRTDLQGALGLTLDGTKDNIHATMLTQHKAWWQHKPFDHPIK